MLSLFITVAAIITDGGCMMYFEHVESPSNYMHIFEVFDLVSFIFIEAK